MKSYLRGLANNLCPIVTKLVSWFDINHARDDTLQKFTKDMISHTQTRKTLAYGVFNLLAL